MKEQKWQEKKLLFKEKRKEKKKEKGLISKPRASYSHLMRFNDLEREIVKKVVKDDGNTVEEIFNGKLTKKEKQKLFNDLCRKGPRVVIDCDFDSMMRENEIKSLGQ